MSADDVGTNPRGADRSATALEDLADRALATMVFRGSSGQGWLDGVEHTGTTRWSRGCRDASTQPDLPIVTP